MANSLMELYGGGMVGNRTNYQLGGRVAASKRRREFASEMRSLRRAAERAAERKGRSGLLGTLGSTLGGTLGFVVGGPAGAAIGAGLGRAAGESTYKREDFSGGKYARETRGELGEAEDDFRRNIGERALVTGIQSYLAPQLFEKGADFAKGLFTGPSSIEAGTGLFSGAPSPDAFTLDNVFDAPMSIPSEAPTLASRFGQSANPFSLNVDVPALQEVATSSFAPTADILGNQTLSSLSDTALGNFNISSLPEQNNFDAYAALGGFGPFQMRGGGLINMMPQYQYGGFVKEVEKERFDAMNAPTSFGNQLNSTEENRGFMPRTTSVGGNIGMPIQNNFGYGTATSAAGALRQLGMEDVLNDPRFAEFADDLPQFSMGYQQQIGDIQSSGQQAAQQLRARQRQLGSGFTGFGAGQTQLQQNFRNLGTDMQRQQRGVIEGFQADLLSAIGDIEAKGEFEFGSGPTSTSSPNEALDMIEEAKDMVNSGGPMERLRALATLKELENQGYNIG